MDIVGFWGWAEVEIIWHYLQFLKLHRHHNIWARKSSASSDSAPFDSFLHVLRLLRLVNFSSACSVRAQVPKSQLSYSCSPCRP
jgi:hypothetical protein